VIEINGYRRLWGEFPDYDFKFQPENKSRKILFYRFYLNKI